MTVPSQAKYVQMHCCCQTPGHYHHHIILNAEDLSPPIWSPRRFLGCTGTYRARILIAVPVEEIGVAMTELYAIQTEGRRLAAGPKGWQGWPPVSTRWISCPAKIMRSNSGNALSWAKFLISATSRIIRFRVRGVPSTATSSSAPACRRSRSISWIRARNLNMPSVRQLCALSGKYSVSPRSAPSRTPSPGLTRVSAGLFLCFRPQLTQVVFSYRL